jgi:acyl-coenzyme A thioesterase 9
VRIHRAYTYSHLCAELVAGGRPLLVSAKRIDFYQPVRMGDKLHFVNQVTFTGTTSLAVETSITRISRDRKSTAVSNNCLFTFVNVDPDLQKKGVPAVYPASFTEDARYLAGRRRRTSHLQATPKT